MECRRVTWVIPVALAAMASAGCSQGLARAVGRKNFQRTQELLQAGHDPNTRTSDGSGVLHVAIRNGDANIMRLLLDRGADPNLPDAVGNTPAAMAAKVGRPDLLYFLLQRGARIDIPNQGGYTPFLWACESGSLPVVQMLLDLNAPVNGSISGGLTPLMVALGMGYDAIARVLLSRGAAIDVADRDGETPLMKAIAGAVLGRYSPQDPLAGARLALKSGGDVRAMSRAGHTALSLAALLPDHQLRELLMREILVRPGAIGFVTRLRLDASQVWRASFGRGVDDETLVIVLPPFHVSEINSARVHWGEMDRTTPGAAELCAALGDCPAHSSSPALPIALPPGRHMIALTASASKSSHGVTATTMFKASVAIEGSAGTIHVVGAKDGKSFAQSIAVPSAVE